MKKRVEEHSFSIEIKTKRFVRRISLSDKENDLVFFEGYLGELRNVSMVEGVMLEILGNHGVLRLDITQQEFEECLDPKKLNKRGGGKQ